MNTVVVPAFQYILSGSAFAEAECSEQHEIDGPCAPLTSEIKKKPEEHSEFSQFNESTARAMLAKGHKETTVVQ